MTKRGVFVQALILSPILTKLFIEMYSLYDVWSYLKAREIPFYLLLFCQFSRVLGAIFPKKIDECIFFPFMEKSFPRRIYFPIAFSLVA